MDPDFWLVDLDGTLIDVETAYIHGIVAAVGDRLGVGFSRRETEALWYGFGTARRDPLADRGVSAERF